MITSFASVLGTASIGEADFGGARATCLKR